jgi:hypothetical protein
MLCPKCSQQNQENSKECIKCGIIFEKWQNKQEEKNSPVPINPIPETKIIHQPKSSFPKWIFLVIIIASAIGLKQYFSSTEKNNTSESSSAQIPAANSETQKEEPLPLHRLDNIIAEMNSESAEIVFTRDSLTQIFLNGTYLLKPGYLNTVHSQAGFPEPITRKIKKEEREIIRQGKRVKYLKNNQWIYSESYPETNKGITECWWCKVGSKTTKNSMMIMTNYNALLHWEKVRWQPNFKKWCKYSEEDELNGYRIYIRKKYGQKAMAQDRKTSDSMLQRKLPSNPEKRKERLERAIIEAHRTRILREGAKYQIKKLESLR